MRPDLGCKAAAPQVEAQEKRSRLDRDLQVADHRVEHIAELDLLEGTAERRASALVAEDLGGEESAVARIG